MIDSIEMGEALDTIEEVAPEYAKAKGDRVHLDDYRKVSLAILYNEAVGKTVADKENWCRAHPDYVTVIKGHGNSVEKEAALYWKLKLAVTQIDVCVQYKQLAGARQRYYEFKRPDDDVHHRGVDS